MTKTAIIFQKITKLSNLIAGMTRVCTIIEPVAAHEIRVAISETKVTLHTIDLLINKLHTKYGKEYKNMPEEEYHDIIDKLDTAYARCINIRFPYENTIM